VSVGLSAIRGGTVVDPDGVAERDVVIGDGRIIAVTAPASAVTDEDTVDAGGCLVLPGLVDLHLHGAEGRTFNDVHPAVWRAVLDYHLRHGTTTVLATLMTDDLDQLGAQLETARGLLAAPSRPPSLAGVHLEGPYLAPEQRGAHPRGMLRTPDDGSWKRLAPYQDVLRLMTLAPELPGAHALVRASAAAGVVVAAGHSAADAHTLRAAAANGLGHATHLWSGQSMLRKDGPWREPGLLEAVLASDHLTGELIADGFHLPAPLVRIGHRCLGADRACLVSDASAGTGLPPGTSFKMGTAEGIVSDGVALTADGVSFCGSTSTLLDVLRYTVREAEIPLIDAVCMATTTPARVARICHEVGALRAGLRANATIIDRETLALVAVVQNGHLAHCDVQAEHA
jgi:N-acetylglucosamine-6-phosphate deacetylase